MENYDELVQKCQSGEISYLDFVLGQKELSDLYINDSLSSGITPNDQNAKEWLVNYESAHLYEPQ